MSRTVRKLIGVGESDVFVETFVANHGVTDVTVRNEIRNGFALARDTGHKKRIKILELIRCFDPVREKYREDMFWICRRSVFLRGLRV